LGWSPWCLGEFATGDGGKSRILTLSVCSEAQKEHEPMMISRVCLPILFLTVLLAASSAAEERQIKRSHLPPAVEKTVALQSKGATIRGFSEEKENGQTYYEAQMVVDNHSKDLLVDNDGAIVEVEEQIAIDSLPMAVKEGLQARAGEGKLVKVESITKRDKLVAYEGQITLGKKRSEVQVGPDGNPLDHEE
jgi:hypothetical protein